MDEASSCDKRSILYYRSEGQGTMNFIDTLYSTLPFEEHENQTIRQYEMDNDVEYVLFSKNKKKIKNQRSANSEKCVPLIIVGPRYINFLY